MNINVLWTGGWDSTFRIAQLSRMSGVSVQGIYIVGDKRPSESREIEAINSIISALMLKEDTKAKLMPLRIIKKEDIPSNQRITEAFNRLCKKNRLGTQYEWLARFAYVSPGVELGAIMPDGEFSGVRETINKYGGLLKDGNSYRLDFEKATEDCRLIFGNFGYPLAFTREREMVDIIADWGYQDIMKLTWFCHRPYKGRPCGICRPCEQKMEGKMEFLLPNDAKKRYKIMKIATSVAGNRGRQCLFKLYNI